MTERRVERDVYRRESDEREPRSTTLRLRDFLDRVDAGPASVRDVELLERLVRVLDAG